MGAAATLPMADIDYHEFTGERFSHQVPSSADEKNGAIHFFKKTPSHPTDCTLYHVFQNGLAMDNGTRKCFGTRKIGSDGKVGAYEWLTYSQVAQRIEIVASGIQKLCEMKRQGIVGVFSKNRLEWCLVEHACNRMAYTLVPLYDSLGPDAVPFVVNHTEMRVLFIAKDQFETVLKCKDQCASLKMVIQFDDVTEEQRETAQRKNLTLKSLSELETMGKANLVGPDVPTPEDICTICYTSGTTGNPKGVVLSHRNIASIGLYTATLVPGVPGDVYLSYLPLPHSFERAVHAILLNDGAAIGFYQGDVKVIIEDIQALQPTIFASVPRLLNRVFDKIMQNVDGAHSITKALFNYALATKLVALEDGKVSHALWDTLVFRKVRHLLGGNVRLIISGSAPLSMEVKQFLKAAFSCPMIEGYGLTETAAVSTVAKPDMPLGPHCGIPNVNVEVRLRDVPEMNYTSQDRPRPRGEILIRGDSVFSGYYKQPELTAEVLGKDGWFATGDIGCWNANGTLSIIDRKKNIFKLSQGEYVAPEKIEGVYLKSPFVAQIFVYGNSFKNTLVAVVVPDPDIANHWSQEHQPASSLATLCDNPAFKQAVVTSMVDVGKKNDLRGFEVVKQIHLVPEAFSLEHDLLTPTFKLKRGQLQKYFQADIDRLYSLET